MTENQKSKRVSPSPKTEARTAIAFARKEGESAEKVTISLSIDRKLLQLIDKRWKNLPGLNRSAYFEILAQNDLRSGGSLTILEKGAKPDKRTARDVLK